MKIWKSFAGEHSSNLKIIATFKSVADAKKAENLFNNLVELSTTTALKWSEMWGDNELAVFLAKEQCYDVCTEEDFEKLENFSPVEAIGNTISVKMDNYDMQPLVKSLLFYGAAIEMYDKDSHPEKD